MSTKRRSFEKGHKRKYLLIIDDTEECDRAIFWAAKRASRTKSVIVLLRMIKVPPLRIPPPEIPARFPEIVLFTILAAAPVSM